MLATVEKSIDDTYNRFDLANEIVNRHLLGKKVGTVGRALLDYEAHEALAPKGKFTADSIIDTFEGESFLDQIKVKYAQGYRSTPLTAGQTYGVNSALDNAIQQPEILNLFSDKSTRSGHASILASYVRVYRQHSTANEENKRLNLQVVRSLGREQIFEGALKERIEKYNTLILKRITNPQSNTLDSKLPKFLENDAEFMRELDDLAQAYTAHVKKMELLPNLQKESTTAETNLNTAQDTLMTTLAQVRACTVEELGLVFRDNLTDDLPGAAQYKELTKRKANLEVELAKAEMNIGQESARLEDLVGNDGELTKKRQELVQQSAKLQTALYSAKQAYDNFKPNRLRIESIMKKNQTLTEEERNDLRNLRQEDDQLFRMSLALHDSFGNAKMELESVEKQFIEAKTKLMQLKGNLSEHELISAREKLTAELTGVKASTIPLTHSEITILNGVKSLPAFNDIAEKVSKQKMAVQEHDKAKRAAHLKLEELTRGIQQSTRVLRAAGFIVDENGQIGEFKCEKLNQNNIKTAVEKELEIEGKFSANIIRAVQLFGYLEDNVALAEAINPANHTPVVRPHSTNLLHNFTDMEPAEED